MRIWKYDVPIADEIIVDMPYESKVLTVQMQRGRPVIWALVHERWPEEQRRFRWVGTGHPMASDDDITYVGSVQLSDGDFVFHLFALET